MPETHLGSFISHPTHGLGVVVFAEANIPEEFRTLTVAFPETCEDVLPTRMSEHGFKPLQSILRLPKSYKRLPGHDQIEGWAYDVTAARRALREREVVAG